MLMQPPAPIPLHRCFQAWFVARGLTQFVQRELRPDPPSLDNDRWLFFRFESPNQAPARPGATVAFHGTWWYALRGILQHCRILSGDGDPNPHTMYMVWSGISTLVDETPRGRPMLTNYTSGHQRDRSGTKRHVTHGMQYHHHLETVGAQQGAGSVR